MRTLAVLTLLLALCIPGAFAATSAKSLAPEIVPSAPVYHVTTAPITTAAFSKPFVLKRRHFSILSPEMQTTFQAPAQWCIPLAPCSCSGNGDCLMTCWCTTFNTPGGGGQTVCMWSCQSWAPLQE